MDINQPQRIGLSTLPSMPSILREKKKILQTRQSIHPHGSKLGQKVEGIKNNHRLLSSFQKSVDNSNPRLHTGEKKRPSHEITATSFQQTTLHSRYSLISESKSKIKVLTGEQIRKQLDEKLANINKLLSQRKLSFQLQNNKVSSSEKLRGPGLQRALIHQYLDLIYQDYQIPRLEECSEFTLADQQYEEKFQFLRTQPIDRIKDQFSKRSLEKSVTKGTKSNRRAMELKKMFVKQMLTSSKTEKHPQHSSKPKQAVNKQNIHSSTAQLGVIKKLHESSQQVSHNYRYCLACQMRIQADRESHQKQKCFRMLSNMNVLQLKQRLIEVLSQTKRVGEEIYKEIFGEQQKYFMRKIVRFEVEAKKYFDLIESKLSSEQNDKGMKNKLKSNFKQVTQIFSENWEKLQEAIRKLQWFMFMLMSLEEKEEEENMGRYQGPRMSLR